MSGFEKRSVTSASWKCHLQLGNELTIPCVAFAKTKEAKMKQTWKKYNQFAFIVYNMLKLLVYGRCHARTNKAEDITRNPYYFIDDEQRTEVAKENLAKGAPSLYLNLPRNCVCFKSVIVCTFYSLVQGNCGKMKYNFYPAMNK